MYLSSPELNNNNNPTPTRKIDFSLETVGQMMKSVGDEVVQALHSAFGVLRIFKLVQLGGILAPSGLHGLKR